MVSDSRDVEARGAVAPYSEFDYGADGGVYDVDGDVCCEFEEVDGVCDGN